jgi:hypothetical protein
MPLSDPLSVPSEVAHLQGKDLGDSDSRLFGVRNGLTCLARTREKYCHNGGMAFADQIAAASHRQVRVRGRNGLFLTPCLSPQKSLICRRIISRGSDFAPLGSGMGSLPFWVPHARSTAATGGHPLRLTIAALECGEANRCHQDPRKRWIAPWTA